MVIYIVKVNGKLSSEAYSTLEEARDFIASKLNIDHDIKELLQEGYTSLENNGILYEIHDVTVKGRR